MLLAFLSALTFTGPEKVFNFDPCKLFMISKHDLLKRLWAFVHNSTSGVFRICSTDLCVNGRMGENIKRSKRLHITKSSSSTLLTYNEH